MHPICWDYTPLLGSTWNSFWSNRHEPQSHTPDVCWSHSRGALLCRGEMRWPGEGGGWNLAEEGKSPGQHQAPSKTARPLPGPVQRGILSLTLELVADAAVV